MKLLLVVICCLALVLYSQQQLLGPSNVAYGTGDNYFIGSDGFTKCRACEIDCNALDVFSSCQYRYYRYGCYIQAYCVGSDTAEYMDRFAATAFCMIYNKCVPRTLSISYISNQLARRSPRPDIWTPANIDLLRNPAIQARQIFLNNNRRDYSTSYGYAFLRVRASLVKNFFVQQQVRNYVRFKVIQDLKDVKQKYGNDATTFQNKLNQYWSNYGTVPMWFAQQAMLPLPTTLSETNELLNSQFIPEDYLFDSLNFVSDQITVAYLNGTSNFCLYNEPTSRGPQTCVSRVNTPEAVAAHYFQRFPHMLGTYGTYGEFSEFQKRIFDYKYVRTYMPVMALGPMYHGITGKRATIRAPVGWKLIAMNYMNDNKGITGVYPQSATEWVITAESFNDGTYVKPVMLFDPYNVYEVRIFSGTQSGKAMTEATSVAVHNGYTPVGGGFRLESSTLCNSATPVTSGVFMYTSYPTNNGWAASFTTQNSGISCLQTRQTVFAVGLKRLPASTAVIDHFFPPIFSRIEEPRVFNDRAGCSIMGQGTAGEFPFTELITSGTDSIRLNNGHIDNRAIVTSVFSIRDSYASMPYVFNTFTNQNGQMQISFSDGQYRRNQVFGLTIFAAPPSSISSTSSNTECDRRFENVINDFRNIAISKGANLNNGNLFLSGQLNTYWAEYSRFRPSRSSFLAYASICDSSRCLEKTCRAEACYTY